MLEEEYADDPGNFGKERYDENYIENLCKTANEYGMQRVTHVMGNRAMNSVLNFYEKL